MKRPRVEGWIALTACLLVLASCASTAPASVANLAGKRLIAPRADGLPFEAARGGYYDTVWPSEHADLWRSHATLNAGLPAGFDPGKLVRTSARLDLPVWGYTRADDEVFVIGGSPFTLRGFTEAIRSGKTGGRLDSFGSVVADLLDPSIPYVARIDPRTMKAVRLDLRGGSTVNYTGGLLMHGNGFVYAVSRSVLYKIDPEAMAIVRSLELPLTGTDALSRFWTTYNGLQVLASGELVLKGFHLIDSGKIPGWLLLIDPEDLSIDVRQQAAVSSARLTIQQSPDGPVFLYHVNALASLRYRITDAGFLPDTDWTSPYRAEKETGTQASSPLLFGKVGQIVFADNTAPGAATPIRLFTRAVDAGAPPGGSKGMPAFSRSLPSFNFFMVAGDPFLNQILVTYDPINNLLAAHRVKRDGGLEPLWEREGYKVSASPAVVPDRDLLYVDDYRNGKDHLVVLELSTGREAASVELEATLPTIGTIFPGRNDDVFILSSEAGGKSGRISRISIEGKESMQ